MGLPPGDQPLRYPPILTTLAKDHETNWREAAHAEVVRARDGLADRSTFGGPSHGDGVTPLHLAAQGGNLGAVEALLDAGADPTLRDGLYNSTPAGWAEFGREDAAAELLRDREG